MCRASILAALAAVLPFHVAGCAAPTEDDGAESATGAVSAGTATQPDVGAVKAYFVNAEITIGKADFYGALLNSYDDRECDVGRVRASRVEVAQIAPKPRDAIRFEQWSPPHAHLVGQPSPISWRYPMKFAERSSTESSSRRPRRAPSMALPSLGLAHSCSRHSIADREVGRRPADGGS